MTEITKGFLEIPGVLGVGVDLLSQGRIALSYQKFGDRLVQRILTPEEQIIFYSHTTPINYLAKAFAAKEALVKALGTGVSQGVSFQDFEVYRNDQGKPIVRVAGSAERLMSELGGKQLHLSLTDEGDLIQAFAVLSS